MAASNDVSVLVLGGVENALALVRCLGRRGVRVCVSTIADSPAAWSRFCAGAYRCPANVPLQRYWWDLLLGSDPPERGCLLLAASDDAVEFLALHAADLRDEYKLDASVPQLQLDLLDKHKTLIYGRRAGIPTPRSWPIDTLDAARAIPEHALPLILKPVHSHVFQRHRQGKYVRVADRRQLIEAAADLLDAGIGFFACEFVPGPDSALSSYYAYIDAEGKALCRMTKRVIRRCPPNEGAASYHLTDWAPEAAELGERFLRQIHFRGLANIEFKHDYRDGQHKLIECNPRFTAAQELLVRSGVDTGWVVYRSATGRPVEQSDGFRRGLRLWYPTRDFNAYRQLRRVGQLSLVAWLRSIATRQILPVFQLSDPMPALRSAWRNLTRRLRRRRESTYAPDTN